MDWLYPAMAVVIGVAVVVAFIVVVAKLRSTGGPTAAGGSNLDPSAETSWHAGDNREVERPAVSADASLAAMPETVIRRALEALLTRDPSEAFVVIEHPPTGRIVQFMGADDGIMLDIPMIDFSGEEQERARSFFARKGIKLETYTGSGNTFETYQSRLGKDVDRATTLAIDIFRDVHQLWGMFPLTARTD